MFDDTRLVQIKGLIEDARNLALELADELALRDPVTGPISAIEQHCARALDELARINRPLTLIEGQP